LRFKQGAFGLLDQGTFAAAACTAEPVRFAQFAVQLFETGRGTLQGRQLEVPEMLLDFDPGDLIAEADFLILAATPPWQKTTVSTGAVRSIAEGL
jgi:hypothetical protein